MVQDALRGYVQLASGIGDVTRQRAVTTARQLLDQGGGMIGSAVATAGAVDWAKQVQGLADELVASSRTNRDLLIGIIRTEVERTVSRLGLVGADELASMARVVERLQTQLDAAIAFTGRGGSATPSGSVRREPETFGASAAGPSTKDPARKSPARKAAKSAASKSTASKSTATKAARSKSATSKSAATKASASSASAKKAAVRRVPAKKTTASGTTSSAGASTPSAANPAATTPSTPPTTSGYVPPTTRPVPTPPPTTPTSNPATTTPTSTPATTTSVSGPSTTSTPTPPAATPAPRLADEANDRAHVVDLSTSEPRSSIASASPGTADQQGSGS